MDYARNAAAGYFLNYAGRHGLGPAVTHATNVAIGAGAGAGYTALNAAYYGYKAYKYIVCR